MVTCPAFSPVYTLQFKDTDTENVLRLPVSH